MQSAEHTKKGFFSNFYAKCFDISRTDGNKPKLEIFQFRFVQNAIVKIFSKNFFKFPEKYQNLLIFTQN